MPLYLPLLLLFLVLPVTAEQRDIHLNGDERISFSAPGRAGAGRYCVRHDRAGVLDKDWKVIFSVPAGGLSLTLANQQNKLIPFDLMVKPEHGGRFVPVRNGEVLAQGRSLSNHCSDISDTFILQVRPAIIADLIAGGDYYQQIRLRLIVDEQDIQSLDVQLALHVPERVRLTAAGDLKLPDIDGNNPSSDQVGICVFRNGGGHYSVRMNGNGDQGAYSLKSMSRELDYQTFWQAGSQPPEMLAAGERSQVYRGDSFLDCKGHSNASVQVRVPVTEGLAPSGHYQGLLRITVETR